MHVCIDLNYKGWSIEDIENILQAAADVTQGKSLSQPPAGGSTGRLSSIA